MADWYKASLVRPVVGNDESKKSSSTTNHAVASSDRLSSSLSFTSRRSSVICCNAAVATSQPLASAIGYDLLRAGNANAADAAVAIAAALAVTEPCSTGLGGDVFCLYYAAKDCTISCLNGSGRSPANLTYGHVRNCHPASDNLNDSSHYGIDAESFRDSALAVTVPGAAAAWEDLLLKHGSGNYTLAQLLEPAAILATEGFPVAPITSYHWRAGRSQITKWMPSASEANENPLTSFASSSGPNPGEVVYNHDMARVLREFGRYGAKDGFYRHPTIGQAIVDAVQEHGGCITMDDLARHQSEWVEPISTTYRDYQLWEAPPNGQGIAGLVALAGLHHLETRQSTIPKIDATNVGHADAYHTMIEMMRLGFSDARAFVSDPSHTVTSTSHILDPIRIGKRVDALFQLNRATIHGVPDASSCTVSFQVVDSNGNAISMVNSNYQGFGTGLVPKNCGFSLQNRGFGFHLQNGDHPNCIGPSKRPCHTILPALLTHVDTGELYATLSNMGGNMQPQGHLQLSVNMIAGNMDPQAAIDYPRFCIVDGTQNGVVYMEDGVDENVINELRDRGHINIVSNVQGYERSIFGKAQIIQRNRTTGVLYAGSDGRADGCAMGY